MRIQPWHLIVLLIVVLLLFGANRLPDLARSMGQSLKIFKREIKDLREDDDTPAGTASGAGGTTVPGGTGTTTPGSSATGTSTGAGSTGTTGAQADADRGPQV